MVRTIDVITSAKIINEVIVSVLDAAFEFDIRGCSPRYYEIVPVKLVIDTDNFEWLLCERLLAAGKGE